MAIRQSLIEKAPRVGAPAPPMRILACLSALGPFLLAGAVLAAAEGASPPPAADRSEVRFTISEDALLDWLKTATPYTFSVGNQVLKIDLTLSEPRELKLLDSRATLKIRLRASGIPVDQILQPVLTLRHDEANARYYVVVSSLPVQLPGFGTIDLKDSFPKFEIPELIEDLWKFGDRPVALNLDIRRIAVLEHALMIGADVNFVPASPGGTRGTR
ncbi:MAG TPA: hypothetical protein VKF61_05460 [Candidatus Polarisedimenticolia bacterium]|nr:hypothetical protein [Candidatus Polarisedimenticolia bacterium]